ncbi:MAG: LuxR C-terminal-related transcriptional regulator [Pseudomonadales bacterium]
MIDQQLPKISSENRYSYLVVTEDCHCIELSQCAAGTLGYDPSIVSPDSLFGIHTNILAITNAKKILKAVSSVISDKKERLFAVWIKYSTNVWYKVLCRCSAENNHSVHIILVDVTDIDPRAIWLSRINLATQRMDLGPEYSNRTVSFLEYAVLHFLIRGTTYKNIAAMMNISSNTVSFRIKQLKQAFSVNSVGALLQETHDNKLIHMLTIDLNVSNPAMTDFHLYSLVD